MSLLELDRVDRVRMSRRVRNGRGTNAGRVRTSSTAPSGSGVLTCGFRGSPNGVRTRVSTLRVFSRRIPHLRRCHDMRIWQGICFSLQLVFSRRRAVRRGANAGPGR
jgi:hypothetical protein